MCVSLFSPWRYCAFLTPPDPGVCGLLSSGLSQGEEPCFPSASPWPEPALSQTRGRWLPAGPKHHASLLLHPDRSPRVLRREDADFRLGPSTLRRLNHLFCREHGSWTGKPEEFRPFTGPFWPSCFLLCVLRQMPVGHQTGCQDLVPTPAWGRERPPAAGCGDFSLCHLSCRLGQRAPGPRSEEEEVAGTGSCWQALSGDGSPLYHSLQWYR